MGARVMVDLPQRGRHDRQNGAVCRKAWLDENGEYLGPPVDVAQLRDGSLLVSDDFAGALYRIWYDGK